MAKKPAEQWYSGDWFRSVDVRKCTWSTRGIWREMLDIMMNEQETGKIKGSQAEICRLVGCMPGEFGEFIEENKRHKFADVTFCNGHVTIINRRLYRAFLAREDGKKRIKRHREKVKKERNEKVTCPSSKDAKDATNTKDSISKDISTNGTHKRGLVLEEQKAAMECAGRLEEILGPFTPAESKTFMAIIKYLLVYSTEHGTEIFGRVTEWAVDKRDYVSRRKGKSRLDAVRMFVSTVKKRTGYGSTKTEKGLSNDKYSKKM